MNSGADMNYQQVERKPVRALQRGLNLLQTLNALGRANPGALAVASRLPRATVYRMLDTMEAQGFIKRAIDGDNYYPTHMVQALSRGFTEHAWVHELAAPVAMCITRKIGWPACVATFDPYAMHVRETTLAISPMAVDSGMAGRRLGMLKSAVGRVYLANCPDAEREDILLNLRNSPEEYDQVARDPAYVQRVLSTTRMQGFATKLRGGRKGTRTASLSLPIKSGDRVVGSLAIIWIASALSADEAAGRYLDVMRRGTDLIERQFRAAAPF